MFEKLLVFLINIANVNMEKILLSLVLKTRLYFFKPILNE